MKGDYFCAGISFSVLQPCNLDPGAVSPGKTAMSQGEPPRWERKGPKEIPEPRVYTRGGL